MTRRSLDDELDHYNRHLGAIEEDWQARSREVELCHKIEEAVAKGLQVLQKIDRGNEQWIEAVRSGATKFYWHKAGEISQRYKYWLVITSILLGAIEYCESLGYTVDGSTDFRAQFVRVSGMSLDVDFARRSQESTEILTHAEAMCVVRSRLQRPCT